MELRIVNFNEDKAKQFIYQEDQKTKMKKIDSNSFNLNNIANVTAEKVNGNALCNMHGMILRNNGKINLSEIAVLIHYFYFKGVKKEKERSVMIKVVKDLVENFNLITEHNDDYLNMTYSFKQLFVLMFIFNYCKDKTRMCKLIDKCFLNIDELDNKKFYSKMPKKSTLNEIEKYVKECEVHV